MFGLLNSAALKAEGLAKSVAASVAADVPVYLHIPGPPGHTAAQVRINDVLRDAVIAKDKAAVLSILRKLRARGQAGKFKPIVFSRHAEDGATPNPGVPLSSQ